MHTETLTEREKEKEGEKVVRVRETGRLGEKDGGVYAWGRM